VLSRLRKLVFKIRRQASASRFAESLRRVNRLAHLMTVIQQKGRRRDRKPAKEAEGR
jgi:hypothetical protein